MHSQKLNITPGAVPQGTPVAPAVSGTGTVDKPLSATRAPPQTATMLTDGKVENPAPDTPGRSRAIRERWTTSSPSGSRPTCGSTPSSNPTATGRADPALPTVDAIAPSPQLPVAASDTEAAAGPQLSPTPSFGLPGIKPKTNTILNIYQLNTQKSKPAHDLVITNTNRRPAAAQPQPTTPDGCDSGQGEYFVALIQEPYCNKGKIPGYNGLTSFKADGNTRVRSCIYTSKHLKTIKYNQFTNNDIVTVGVKLKQKTIVFCSAYLPNNNGEPENPVDPIILDLINHCEGENIDLIIGTDSNSHHLAWGCLDTNARGLELFNFIVSRNLNICNVGDSPTFSNAIRETVLDLTITNNLNYSILKEWKVLDTDSLSDHNTIFFTINLQDSNETEPYRNIRKLRTQFFRTFLKKNFAPPKTRDLNEKTKYLTDIIIKAYQEATPLSKGGKARSLLDDPDIKKLRRDLNKLRKQWKRGRVPTIGEKYRETKVGLQKLTKKKRKAEWKNFCKSIENTGESSRIIKMLKGNNIVGTCTLKNNNNEYTRDPLDTLNLLFNKHFPALVGEEEPPQLPPVGNNLEIINHITLQSVREAIFSFKKFKSPGADGIFPILLQEGFEVLG